jgi:biotin carboxyl carrier protein
MRYLVRIGGQQFAITEIDSQQRRARLNGQLVDFDFQHVRGSLYSLIIAGRSFAAHLECDEQGIELIHGPNWLRLEVEDERAAILKQLARSEAGILRTVDIKAPMPGLVVRLSVQKGEPVKRGQSLVVIEAMKMENDVKSPADGVVAALHVAERTAVEKNARLITLTT